MYNLWQNLLGCYFLENKNDSSTRRKFMEKKLVLTRKTKHKKKKLKKFFEMAKMETEGCETTILSYLETMLSEIIKFM